METNLTPIDAVSIDTEGGTTDSHTTLILTVKMCHHRAEPSRQYLVFVKAMAEKIMQEIADYLLTYQGEYVPQDNSNRARIDTMEMNLESYPERVVVMEGDGLNDKLINILRHLADDMPIQ